MKNSKVLKAILIVSGLLLTGIGTLVLFIPVFIKAKNGIDVSGSISLINDVRASGALLLGSGILIMLGAFIRSLAYTSTIVSALVFLSYGIGRALSIVLDGVPVEALVKATVVEFVLGFAAVFLLMKYRETTEA